MAGAAKAKQHLPSLEQARSARLEAPVRNLFRTIDLLDRAPRQTRPWAAIELRARFLFREERHERLEIPASVGIGTNPPVPEAFLTAPITHTWVRTLEPHTHTCTSCSFTPGLGLCGACGGTGVAHPREAFDCLACDGGYVTCAMCGGEKRCSIGDIVFVRDYTEHLRRFYFPVQAPWSAAVTSLRTHLETREPPDALRFPLEQRGPTGPYRDGPVGDPEFHGFRFGDALKRARREVTLRERQRPLLAEVRAYAWPLLELHYRVWGKGYRVLLTHDPDHGPEAFVDG